MFRPELNFFVVLVVAKLFLESTSGDKIPVDVSNAATMELANPLPFQYIGTFTVAKNLHRGVKPASSLYFKSQNSAGYSTAKDDCKAFFGNAGSLLQIETQEELKNVTTFLQRTDDTVSSTWVGGQYDTKRQAYFWENGIRIGPWAPWDAADFEYNATLTRVYISFIQETKFRTQLTTTSTRYICEVKVGDPDEEPEPCYTDNDLVIALDSSGSIGLSNYKLALDFVARLATAWADNPGNRLAVMAYSSSVEFLFHLNRNLAIPEMRNIIYNSHYQQGSTQSDLALEATIQEFQNNPRRVPRSLVFLTDGESNNPDATLQAARRVGIAAVRAFSVGIGSYIRDSELLAIAGNNSSRVFNTDEFSRLLKLLKPVSRRVCLM